MKPIVIWRTRNGYIVTDDDSWMTSDDIANCHVFNTLSSVANFIEGSDHVDQHQNEQKPEKKTKTTGHKVPDVQTTRRHR